MFPISTCVTPKFTHYQGDDSIGYFVQPTVILTKDPKSITMVEEIFGPVLTVRAVTSGPSPTALT